MRFYVSIYIIITIEKKLYLKHVLLKLSKSALGLQELFIVIHLKDLTLRASSYFSNEKHLWGRGHQAELQNFRFVT